MELFPFGDHREQRCREHPSGLVLVKASIPDPELGAFSCHLSFLRDPPAPHLTVLHPHSLAKTSQNWSPGSHANCSLQTPSWSFCPDICRRNLRCHQAPSRPDLVLHPVPSVVRPVLLAVPLSQQLLLPDSHPQAHLLKSEAHRFCRSGVGTGHSGDSLALGRLPGRPKAEVTHQLELESSAIARLVSG